MKNTQWTPWMENPISAAYLVADQNGIDRSAVNEVLLQVGEWKTFTPKEFLDDLLQEIAGKTNIVVQYDSKEHVLFRAALDDN